MYTIFVLQACQQHWKCRSKFKIAFKGKDKHNFINIPHQVKIVIDLDIFWKIGLQFFDMLILANSGI